ncbi:hypothetical protein BJF78_31750 [Pseudonocardia sp. CNS-139]|nr:hypothetical protein BJF78_31750 [Pseudonocardia sp. CNS-139]
MIIGDTVQDVVAGRDGGAAVIAVATGRENARELQAAGADVVLTDLASIDDFAAAFRATTGR